MEGLSDITGGPLLDYPQTVYEQFESIARRHHDRPALIEISKVRAHEPPPQGSSLRQWTYKELLHAVSSFVPWFESHGMGPGSILFVLCHNRAEYIIATLAAYAAGWIHVPINPNEVSSKDDVQYIIDTVVNHFDPASIGIVAQDRSVRPSLDRLRWPAPTVQVSFLDDQVPWLSFNQMSTLRSKVEKAGKGEARSVLFTSGTASRPKGCPLRMTAYIHVLINSLGIGNLKPGDKLLSTAPSYHAFGLLCTILPLVQGACVVFAGNTFDPLLTIDTIQHQECTHLCLVPTMLHGLEQFHSTFNSSSLHAVLFAGMVLSPDALRRCLELFGNITVENLYGMSEGVVATTGPVGDVSRISHGQDVAVGRPGMGARIRICDPGQRSPLAVGLPGQLHYAGSSLIQHYLGASDDDFHDEPDGLRWFNTGDQAFVGTDGLVYLVGRYKDLIIRGGENLSPARIEGVLAEVPELRSLNTQIVAGGEPIAGEVPVAVVAVAPSAKQVSLIQSTVRSVLGVIHVPTAVVSLQDLGIDDFPRTAAGKIRKSNLCALYRLFEERQAQHGVGMIDQPVDVTEAVTGVWARTLGIKTSEIDVDAPLSNFADSILQLTTRHQIEKATGRCVALAEWLQATSITEQISLLASSDVAPHTNGDGKDLGKDQQVPDIDSAVYATLMQRAFERTRLAVENVLGKDGLSWEDVAEVIPCRDAVQVACKSRLIDSASIRTCMLCNGATAESARHAFVTALAEHPILLSYLVVDDKHLDAQLGLYVVLRQTPEILDRCIHSELVVDSLEELTRITTEHPFRMPAVLPGPNFGALIVSVRETQSAAIITNIAHTVVDKTNHGLFNRDLDSALSGNSLDAHLSFKSWADTQYKQRTSPKATEAVNFYVDSLQGLKTHHHALWPIYTPEINVPPHRLHKAGETIVFAAPSIARLRQQQPHLTAPILVKAALILLILSRTNHTHALFVGMEAARSEYAFPDPGAPALPSDAVDVAGPTFNWSFNLVAFRPDETVLDFLMRVYREQLKQTKHANVPWHRVFEGLDLSADEILTKVTNACVFNWMPGLGPDMLGANPYTNLKPLVFHVRPKVGLVLNAGQGGPDGSQLVLMAEGAIGNGPVAWGVRVLEEMKRNVLWVSEEGNVGRPVRDFVEALGWDLAS
ncbi:acetyl-CoA synthetase-like protein [Aspergillus aculeatinus CBS 121060]|uniref:Acetyl-CoA synthetase-like protein n=1 Tax=Aspergillus aculeatinus CBS 121060 TaxID=1448322 RepID=A0ACD1HEN6_9EURO|nr:acetyl-CoA synthetase-like protein [Aspergillus aculeatinus CBS 121060]RAH71873.1 acetyl-CoA synthetase-like protein [Aspergillus aculeatinus CBS 121060]